MRSVLIKWCGKPWLITIYAAGLFAAVLAAERNGGEMPGRLLCFLAILLPFHVFEENTWPGGFHYMLNLVQKSERPNAGPMNRLSDMVSNFGAELLVLLLALWGGNIGTSILVAFFGIGKTIVHTVLGVMTRHKLKNRGMKTIYGPGLFTAYFALLPLSIYAVSWLRGQTIRVSDALTGILLIVCVIALLIRVPVRVLGKYQTEYAFESGGWFRKFE